jgi:hypothetical protein
MSFDFIAACRPGMVLRTRDRGEAIIHLVSAEDGFIHGEVRMFGPCAWRRDGRYRDSPGAAAGPLDLTPPAAAMPKPSHVVSMKDALEPAGRPFCCD